MQRALLIVLIMIVLVQSLDLSTALAQVPTKKLPAPDPRNIFACRAVIKLHRTLTQPRETVWNRESLHALDRQLAFTMSAISTCGSEPSSFGAIAKTTDKISKDIEEQIRGFAESDVGLLDDQRLREAFLVRRFHTVSKEIEDLEHIRIDVNRDI